MTADQLITTLFTDYWLLTTVFMPHITFIYAWVTGQVFWCLTSFLWAAVLGTQRHENTAKAVVKRLRGG